jgi:polysaccharide chain length determinant protein (PEP-CTERM system associated)
MIPGRTYTPLECVHVAWRRRWVWLLPLALCAIGAGVLGWALPARYRSETVILVVPQRVPENYVRPTITAGIEDRLQTITQQIMSRTRLERIVLEYGLYADLRRTWAMSDVIERMRRDIAVELARDGARRGDASFTISYISTDPATARRVTERLATLFIEENVRDREVLVEGTNQFLETQLDEARSRLIATEERLEAYRRAHAGELPSQLTTNLQVIQNLQTELQSLSESINRDADRRLTIDQLLANQGQAASLDARLPGAGADGGDGLPLERQLEIARNQLATIERRLTPLHPDVSRARREVAQLEERLALQPKPGETLTAVPATAAERVAEERTAQVRAEMESLDRQLTYKRREEGELKARLAVYSARVDAAPERESELVELTRDYETLQQLYTGLLAKKEESRIATELERRQVGEQFNVLDPASIPATPFSPNRLLILAFGIVAGLGMGAALTALLEYRDTTLRTGEDIARFLSLPVAGVIPVLGTRRRVFGWARNTP